MTETTTMLAAETASAAPGRSSQRGQRSRKRERKSAVGMVLWDHSVTGESEVVIHRPVESVLHRRVTATPTTDRGAGAGSDPRLESREHALGGERMSRSHTWMLRPLAVSLAASSPRPGAFPRCAACAGIRA